MTTVEKAYTDRLRKLGGAGRLQIVAGMIASIRAAYELQVLNVRPGLSGQALRIATARRMYRHNPRTLALLRRLEPDR